MTPVPVSRPSLPPLEEYVRLLEDIWSRRMPSDFSRRARQFEEKAQTYLGNPFTRAVVNCDIASSSRSRGSGFLHSQAVSVVDPSELRGEEVLRKLSS